MKIVVAATSFPRNPADHAGRFVYDLSRGFAEAGHSVHHVVPGADGAPATEVLDHGMTVERVRYGRMLGLDRLAYGDGIGENVRRRPWLMLGVPLLERAMKRALRAALGTGRGETLLSHWVFPSGLWCAEIARETGVPHVLCEHGGGVQALARAPGGRRLFERALRGAAHVFFVSEDLRRKAAALYGGALPVPVSVRPMGIDTAVFARRGHRDLVRREILGEAHWGTKVIISVGRLVRLKGHDLLIRAATDIHDLELWFAGDGPERESLERLARSLGVRARFFGRVDHARLAPLLEAADFACLPSRLGPGARSEGSPVSLVEAFAAGLFAVGSRTGGIAETIVEGRNGRLFDADDANGLRTILLDLLADPAQCERLAAGARASAAAADRKVVAAAFLEVIERAYDARMRGDG